MIQAYIAIERIDVGDVVFIEDGIARRWRPKDGPLEKIALDPTLRDRATLHTESPSPVPFVGKREEKGK